MEPAPKTFPDANIAPVTGSPTWPRAIWLFIALSYTIRLFFLGFTELIPEEAYYWQFSRRLDWSYLDHPPLSAWLIYLGTSLFGHNEFGVRLFAWLCSIITGYFVFRATRELFDFERALAALAIFSLLPYFFLGGFLATPDAPLMMCWSGMLYYTIQALQNEKTSAWIGIGLWAGLGMISKYTIALNGLALLLLLLLHRPSRRWLASPYPYIAALVALCMFSPVLYWNATHDWASFSFQTSRRLNEKSEFSLHILALHILCLLTPAGIAALAAPLQRGSQAKGDSDKFRRLFFLLSTFTPVAVFAAFSLRHEPKPNWTGPAFLAALPFMAVTLLYRTDIQNRFATFARRTWAGTFVVLIALYSFVFTYVSVGLPGIGYSPRSQRYASWTDLGKQVAAVREDIYREHGVLPIVVGMDKHFIASALAFYTPALDGSGPIETSAIKGRSIFGMDSLMWQVWDKEYPTSAPLILVARSSSDLEKPEISNYVQELSPIRQIVTTKNGSKSGIYYLRSAMRLQSQDQPEPGNVANDSR